MLSLVTFPTPSEMISSTGAIANPWFQEYLPFLYVGIGVFLAFLLLGWFIDIFKAGIAKLFAPDPVMTKADAVMAETEKLLASTSKHYGLLNKK